MSWPELLAKFNVLVARLASIQDELVSRQLGGAHKHPSTDANLAQNPLALDNSVLRRTIVYPVRPTTTDQERQVLPVLLKSMLLPDISKEDTALLEQLQEIEGEGAAPSSGTATTTVVEGQLARRRANVNRLDTLYRDLGNYMDELVRDSKASLHARVEIQNPYAVAAEAAQRRRDAMQKAVATLWKSPNSPQSAAATAASTSSGISGDTVEGTLMFLSGRV
ncbi:hypothetical protein GQ42DRAFT_156445 [Ramicandelaber brevisporus]|nr:hypothetical protein GQ42DRAFT_156445 [Ramicandelaber brevisporus]